MKEEKKLYVGTVNGESSVSNKKAKTYIQSKDPDNAALGLFKRYKNKFGRAQVTDLFEVDRETKKRTRVRFNLQNKFKEKV